MQQAPVLYEEENWKQIKSKLFCFVIHPEICTYQDYDVSQQKLEVNGKGLHHTWLEHDM